MSDLGVVRAALQVRNLMASALLRLGRHDGALTRTVIGPMLLSDHPSGSFFA